MVTGYYFQRPLLFFKISVPKTGFEPARRFQRYHLKVVRLPVSPPGPEGEQNYIIMGIRKNQD